MKIMKVLELYSGIGGMHAALKASGLTHEVMKAFEINDSANSVYNDVYHCSLASNRAIEECRAYNADLWTMSPPCQPFTRLGNQKQGSDGRSSSFHVVIDLIKQVKPPAIFLENVKGFEGSDCWKKLIEVLLESDYDFRQFLLTPLQFGIPNCRLRYYLVAKLRKEPGQNMFEFGEGANKAKGILENIEDNILRFPIFTMGPLPGCSCAVCTEKVKNITSFDNNYDDYLPFCDSVSEYLLPDDGLPDDVYLSDDILQKYYRILDIVQRDGHKTACFTKGYAQRYEGTGSFLVVKEAQIGDDGEYGFPVLRRFHSKEIAKLMCFPNDFEFPSYVTEKQRIKLLGNSINVLVVSHIMHWTLSTPEKNNNSTS